jgi:glutamine synthetase adenylyltransferase
MVDAEFAVQYLVLAHSASHPELVGNVGNIALLQRAEQVGLLPAGVGHAAADAYAYRDEVLRRRTTCSTGFWRELRSFRKGVSFSLFGP